jgi:hypothetical protein
MKVQLNFFAILAGLMLSNSVLAQTTDTAIKTNEVSVKKISFSIAQASDNKFTQSEPAKFNATFPKDQALSNSYLFNGYLSLDYNTRDMEAISLTAELQRNTLAEKKQHVQQYGLKYANIFLLSGERGKTSEYLSYDLSAKYTKDRVLAKEGAQFILALSYIQEKAYQTNGFLNILRPNTILPNGQSSFAKLLQFQYIPSVGLEYIAYEQLGMLTASFGLEVYPFSGLLYDAFGKYNLLQMKWNITGRQEFTKSNTNLYVGSLRVYGAALNLQFDDTNAVTLGYENSKGGNPMKGLANQEFGQFAVGIKTKF